ncbi:hypothetical protein [Streptomyces avicenniae]|uniref:hypothetical protein n=1 Tax=Streptomyces avicenniae TaxID=500153 RepID=UPI00167D2C40|nr:hypothetical protein [Streptomyces avicenniae]
MASESTTPQHVEQPPLELRPSGAVLFSPDWVAQYGAAVAPFLTTRTIPTDLLGRLIRGAGALRADRLLLTRTDDPANWPTPSSVAPTGTALDIAGDSGPWLFASTPDRSGCLLATPFGYALLGGTPEFAAAAFPENDRLRAAFWHHASSRVNNAVILADVSRSLPPVHRSWAAADSVPPHAATAQQLRLIRGLLAQQTTPADFTHEWLAARRAALAAGERVRGPLNAALDEVFYVLEDFEPDPALREPEEIGEEQFGERVRQAAARLWPEGG